MIDHSKPQPDVYDGITVQLEKMRAARRAREVWAAIERARQRGDI